MMGAAAVDKGCLDRAVHIAVDGSAWGGDERGVAVATRRLWSALPSRMATARLSILSPWRRLAADGSIEVSPRRLRGATRVAWEQIALPALVRQFGVDLLYCPSYTAPVAAPCRLVVTVHDLIAWSHPQLAKWGNVLHLRMFEGAAIRRAGAVCVPTEFVRDALVEQFEVSPGKVFVVPWGVDAGLVRLPREKAAEHIRRQFGVDEPFVLFCGCVEPKKNVRTAIRASAKAGLLILIVGPWISSSQSELPDRLRTGGRWRYLGYVSTDALSALYSAASALLYPSLVEGFGIPVIEAMRCGCPVVTSTAPALLEVCGGAALHASPWDIAAFASHLRAIADQPALRDALVGRGVERASRFTWGAAADLFAEALHHAARCEN